MQRTRYARALMAALYAKGLALYGNPITFICLGATGLACLSILLWPFVAYAIIFLFDAPDSLSNPIVWIIALLMLLYPVPVAFGTFTSWKAHNETNNSGLAICSINFILLYAAFTLKLW